MDGATHHPPTARDDRRARRRDRPGRRPRKVDPARRQPRLPDPRRELGRRGEELAAAHLRGRGFRVLARNVRTRHGEIDLIAYDGDSLVFAEVKTRSAATGAGPIRSEQEPLCAFGPRQRARLRRLAVAWLATEGADRPTARLIRFDALGVVVDQTGALRRLEHVEAAW